MTNVIPQGSMWYVKKRNTAWSVSSLTGSPFIVQIPEGTHILVLTDKLTNIESIDYSCVLANGRTSWMLHTFFDDIRVRRFV